MSQHAVHKALSLALLTLWLGSSPAERARAQGRFNVEAFGPAPDQHGSLLNVVGARTLAPGAYGLTLMGSYARKPLTIEDDSGDDLGELVGSVGTLQWLGVYGVAKRFDIGFGIPVHRVSAGSEYDVAPPLSVQRTTLQGNEVAFGDIRLVPRVGLVQHEGDRGFDIAFVSPLWLPTGKDSTFAGEPFRIEPGLAAAYQHPSVLFAFNAGYHLRSEARIIDATIDDMLRLGAGAEVKLYRSLSALAEVSAQLNLLSDDFRRADAPVEMLGALRFRRWGMLAQLGAGPGVVRGMTSPQYRVLASIGYAREPKAFPNRDGDGLRDQRDPCMKEPDQAGCSEPDNDGDGVLDPSDRCVNEAEDTDGHEDIDGCPDPDNDGDGVLDAQDLCPNEKGVAGASGCSAPEPKEEAELQVTESHIELKETVYFASGSDKIEERSFPLLDQVVKVVREHPEFELIVIEGHTDDRGKPDRNRHLSLERARAVVLYIAKRGIAITRLRPEGFGPDRPIAPNDTDEGRAKNRRVEMRIEKRLDAANQAAQQK